MSETEISFEEKLTDSLSKENINRQIIATLLSGSTPEQLAGALFITSTLFNEAMELLKKSMERLNNDAKLERKYKYLFEAMEQHADRGYKILKSAKAGHEKVYGTQADKEEKKRKIMNKCIEVSNQYPSWNITSIRQQVADELGDGYSFKTVQRASPKLKELLKK